MRPPVQTHPGREFWRGMIYAAGITALAGSVGFVVLLVIWH